MSEKPIISAAEVRKLLELRAAGSPGDWRIEQGVLARSLWITTWMRERDFGGKGCDGAICSVSTEKVFTVPSRRGSRTHDLETRPLPDAEGDAKLIVAAVNALPRLCAALLGPGQVDEAAWLIEFRADKYGPTRWLAIGEPPVINASDATRFSRKVDAETYIRVHGVKDGKATEHSWIGVSPKTLEAADPPP